jgi:hypothetical protein
MKAVGAWERVSFGKRIGERWGWFFEQVKDCLVSSVPKWLRQSFELFPGPVWEAENPVTH